MGIFRRQCSAIGCRSSILREEVFCARCLVMVESDTRKLLGKHFRPLARKQSATFHHWLSEAQREVVYFKTAGHPVPKDRPFQWDDGEIEML